MKSEWKKCKLGEICHIKGGKRLPKGTNLITKKNLHPYIRIKNLGQEKTLELNSSYEYVEEKTQKSISKYIVNSGDIVLSIVGSIGLVGIIGRSLNNANLTENCVKLANLKEINSDFLYYYLISPKGQNEIAKGTVGAVQPKLPIKNIQNIDLDIPPLFVQKKIVGVLKSLDDKIELNNKINNNLEKQVSALYQSWFENFDLANGVCPENWNNQTLSMIANISSGKRPPTKSEVYGKETPIPIVGAASVMGFTTETNHTDKILITGRVGTHGIIQRFNTPCWASDNTLVITSPFYEYAYQILQRIDYSSLNRGSTQPLITQGDMNNVLVLIPDKETLAEFEKFAGSLMSKWEANNEENLKLASLRDTLLPRLMSGEIDVSEVEI